MAAVPSVGKMRNNNNLSNIRKLFDVLVGT